MIEVKRDFEQRANEVDLYFSFMEKIILREARLTFKNGKHEIVDPNLTKILRANGFLLLYNLVESSLKRGVEEIYLSIRKNGNDFNQIKDGIKREIVNYLKSDRMSSDNFVVLISDIALDVLEHCYSVERSFSGNIDARKVRDVATRYGFSAKTDRRSTRDGVNLLTVKDRRNGLAHGDYSFQECGKEYSVQEMMKIKREVTSYMRQLLENIETYIKNQEYLR